MATVKIGELRGNLAEVLEFVKTKQQPVTVTRHGKPYAKIVPVAQQKEQPQKFGSYILDTPTVKEYSHSTGEKPCVT